MNHFFVEESQVQGSEIIIQGTDVNHIKNVLRLSEGERIKICDSDNKINYIT